MREVACCERHAWTKTGRKPLAQQLSAVFVNAPLESHFPIIFPVIQSVTEHWNTVLQIKDFVAMKVNRTIISARNTLQSYDLTRKF